MPKKGENMKAVAAKQRKDEKAAVEKSKKEKEIEDAYWKDDDRNLAKKQVCHCFIKGVVLTDLNFCLESVKARVGLRRRLLEVSKSLFAFR